MRLSTSSAESSASSGPRSGSRFSLRRGSTDSSSASSAPRRPRPSVAGHQLQWAKSCDSDDLNVGFQMNRHDSTHSAGGSFQRKGCCRRIKDSLTGGNNPRRYEDTEDEAGKKKKTSRLETLYLILERAMSEHGRKAQFFLLLLIGLSLLAFYGMCWAVLVWRFEEKIDPRPRARVSPYIEGFWAAWTFMSDAGSHARFYHAEQRFFGGAITATGIIFLNCVLAVVVDMVRERMNSIRTGTGALYETGHTLIVNWSDKTVPLIAELCMGNAADGGGLIVVLAKESIEVMQQDLNMQLPKAARMNTKIIFRHGSAHVVSDLIKVSADRASATIILASEKLHKDEADAATLRCILSLQSMSYIPKGHFVAEVLDIDNENLTGLVGRKYVETFVSHDVLGRLMLMSVRQSGLASVWDELLGFQGNEFYLQTWPELDGVDFSELLGRFPDAVPVGILSAQGELLMNPPQGICLKPEDELIVIAQDLNSYAVQAPVEIDSGDMPPPVILAKEKERILICGWRRDIRDVLQVLDLQAAPGSEVHVMTHSLTPEQRNHMLEEDGLKLATLKRIELFHLVGNTSVRRRLEAVPLETYSSCIIFADQAYDEDSMAADSHSLATLVLIRDIQASLMDQVTCPITCEVVDSRTHRMIVRQKSLIQLSDFVQSNRFVARILAMVSKQRHIKPVLQELLGAQGNSLLIMPSHWVVGNAECLSFWAVAKRVATHNAVLLGYQEIGGAKVTVLNPADKGKHMMWTRYDLAVIANDKRQMEEEEEACFAVDTGRRSHVKDGRAKKTLTTTDAAPLIERHASTDWDEENSEASAAEATSEATSQGVISAEVGHAGMVKAASRVFPLMTPAEQKRFGLALVQLSEVVKSGALEPNNYRRGGVTAAHGPSRLAGFGCLFPGVGLHRVYTRGPHFNSE